MKLNILKMALIAPLIVACSEIEEPDSGASVATFAGSIEGLSTRVKNTSWSEKDSIGISVTTEGSATVGTNVQYVTTAGDGTFVPVAATIAYADKNKVEFSAYYPYTASGNIDSNGNIEVSTVAANQGEAIDYMYATGSGRSVKPNVSLQFSHKMSQVVLNFKAGDGVTDFSGSNMNYTLGGLVHSGTFCIKDGSTALAAGAKATDFTLTPSSTAYSDDKKSVSQSLIFLPQTLSSVSLDVTVGETKYSASLSLPTVDDVQGLFAGYSVSYDITVNKTTLSASSGRIIGWAETEGDFSSGLLGTHMAKDAKLYDLAMGDGSFVSVWPKDDTETLDGNIAKLSAMQKAGVVGIVYYRVSDALPDTPLKDDKVLAAEYPDCTHGYILALNDAARYVKWQENEEGIYSSFQSKTGNLVNPETSSSPQYESIVIEYDDSKNPEDNITTQLNKSLGYNNTKVLRAYNYYYADNEHKVIPIEYLDKYAATNVAPMYSSGWYLPSPKELELLLSTDELKFREIKSGDSDQMADIISILKSLSTASEMQTMWYWTSSECKYKVYASSEYSFSYSMVVIPWNTGGKDGRAKEQSKNYDYHVRAVCAF